MWDNHQFSQRSIATKRVGVGVLGFVMAERWGGMVKIWKRGGRQYRVGLHKIVVLGTLCQLSSKFSYMAPIFCSQKIWVSHIHKNWNKYFTWNLSINKFLPLCDTIYCFQFYWIQIWRLIWKLKSLKINIHNSFSGRGICTAKYGFLKFGYEFHWKWF